MIKITSALGALALGSALLGGGAVSAAAPTAAAAVSCPTGWGSLPKMGGKLSPAPGTFQRIGRHPCYDRVVFHFRGGANGYDVRYVKNVYSEGRGAKLTIKGGAKLEVHLLDPTTHVSYVNPAGFTTLRDVVFGGSFEGYTTFGVGVRARLPFRVFTLHGVGSDRMIVLDIAHRW
jgi:hypothetical protein